MKATLRPLMLLFFFAVLSCHCFAVVGDGNTLMSLCQNADRTAQTQEPSEPASVLQCQAYIEGVFTGYSMVSKALNLKQVGIENVCVPDEVTLGQITKVVVKYLKDHPEKLHLGAGQLTMTAIKDAFPCK